MKKIPLHIGMAILILNLSCAYAEEENTDTTAAIQEGVGCALLTGATMIGSFAAGPGELIMIAGGGSLAPSATAPLMISLTATVYAAACGIGMAATPVALWFFEQVGVFIDGLWSLRFNKGHRPNKPFLTTATAEKYSPAVLH